MIGLTNLARCLDHPKEIVVLRFKKEVDNVSCHVNQVDTIG
jgi:hypothetical protein